MGGWPPAISCGLLVLAVSAALVGSARPSRYRRWQERPRAEPPRPWWLVPLAGLLAALLVRRYGERQAALLPAVLVLLLFAVVLCVVDLDVHRLPDLLVIPAYPIELALLALAAGVEHEWDRLLHAVIWALVLAGGYLALAVLAPRAQGLGLGDVKLAGLVGLVLGYVGTLAVVVGVYAGFLLGGLVALALLAARRVRWAGAIAYGPAMLGGAFVGLLVPGTDLLQLLTG